jgi:biopolymer transport protein ExbD
MSALSDIAQEEVHMEMTPMIDVTFLLLIFFLCTIKFKILEGKLAAYLPKDVGVNSSPAEPKEKIEIVIMVDVAGSKVYATGKDMGLPWQGENDRRFEFTGRKLIYQIGPRKTKKLTEVGKWMKDFFRKDPESPTTIDCRPGTVYGDMVPVLDVTVDAGFSQITFIGEKQPTKK